MSSCVHWVEKEKPKTEEISPAQVAIKTCKKQLSFQIFNWNSWVPNKQTATAFTQSNGIWGFQINSSELLQQATESCQYPFYFNTYKQDLKCQRAQAVCTTNKDVW